MDTDDTRSAPARIELVGTPRLRLEGDVAHALERKDAALLALLALEGPTPRARAAGLLWPGVDDEAARNNLRQRLHRLRKRAGRELVVTRHDVLQLAADVALDVAGAPSGATAFPGDGGAIGELLGTFTYDDCGELDEWVLAARTRHRSAQIGRAHV